MVPINYLYNNPGDIQYKLSMIREAIGYNIREIDKGGREGERITQYHFLLGLHLEIEILEEQLESYFKKHENLK